MEIREPAVPILGQRGILKNSLNSTSYLYIILEF